MAYILREDKRYYWLNVNEKAEACGFILGHPRNAHLLLMSHRPFGP